MTELIDKSVPTKFHICNGEKKERSIHLAEKARDFLIVQNIPITEASFLNATKIVDDEGLGISHNTIYRNETVHEIFKNLHPETHHKKRYHKKKKISNSKRAKDKIIRDKYRDFHKIEIAKLLEEANQEIFSLRERVTKLIVEKKAFKEERDKQLILLTKLKEAGKY
jgi:hypothetical protein